MEEKEKWEGNFFIGCGEISPYAKKIGDDNPLHSSKEVAMDAGFDDIIAPGAMIDVFITETARKKFPLVLVLYREIRFLKPVYEVSEIQVICTLIKEKKTFVRVAVEIHTTNELVAKGSCLLFIPQMRKEKQQTKELEKEYTVV